jgi:hypothetical protein
MALEDFDFPYHTFETVNPETGFRGKFGGSYLFTATPDSPDQRMFKLGFQAMQFFTDSDGSLNSATEPAINMKRLIDFYQTHKLHKSFNYNHPVYGIVEVKFNKPLPEPKGAGFGYGVVEAFEVELVEIP